MINRWLRLLIVATTVLVLIGCSTSRDLNNAKTAIARFHEKFNSDLADEIYSESAPEFQQATTPEHFREFVAGITRKLGKAGNFQATNWNFNFTTGGKFLAIQGETAFAKGKSTESSQVRIDGDRVLIRSWNVNSPMLVIN
jgi:hypothetical protein